MDISRQVSSYFATRYVCWFCQRAVVGELWMTVTQMGKQSEAQQISNGHRALDALGDTTP
jgi:hypothetical protein